MTRPSHPPRLDYSNYTWRRVQIKKLLVMQYIYIYIYMCVCNSCGLDFLCHTWMSPSTISRWCLQFSIRLHKNSLNLQRTKIRPRNKTFFLETEEVIMCCVVRNVSLPRRRWWVNMERRWNDRQEPSRTEFCTPWISHEVTGDWTQGFTVREFLICAVTRMRCLIR
jgi:hypothetical protein